jgi:hypothetical protein
MKTTQIDTNDPSEQRADLLIDDTVAEIRTLFVVDQAFPKFSELTTTKEGDDHGRPKGWLQRFRNWLLRGRSVRRANLAKGVLRGGDEPESGG